VTAAGGRIRFGVRVIARASRNAAAGERDGALVVRVTAAPVDGAANAAVTAVVANSLGLARRDVVLERGERSRDKVVSVPASARERLAAL
jgi:uncharacterized protein